MYYAYHKNGKEWELLWVGNYEECEGAILGHPDDNPKNFKIEEN